MPESKEEILATQVLEETPIGPLTVIAGPQGVAEILFGAFTADPVDDAALNGLLQETCAQLSAYFGGKLRQFDLPLDWQGLSAYQEMVLRACYAIPYGQVLTYGQLAAQTGNPKAARAVGGFMASNRLPIVIPCHRVIGSDGSLHGYAGPGGLQDKAWLLTLEGHRIERQKLV